MKIVILFILIFKMSIFANINETQYQAQKVLSGLGVIWGFDFIDENKMIINEKEGNIYLANFETKKLKKIYYLDVHNKSQGGLLDVKISPNFKTDKTIFFTYVKSILGNGHTTLAKAIFENDELQNFQDILVTKSGTNQNYHFGSRITFDDKHIYFTLGDRGSRMDAQNLDNHIGSVIRLNIDGSIPKDNPYINDKNALDEIYSFGHRNAQGIFYDKTDSNLWLVEHGPRGGDEINLIKAKQNYGWPIVSRGKEYRSNDSVGVPSKAGIIDAKKYYIPSIAPSSMILYRGKNYPNLNGKLLVGALKERHINILTIDENSNNPSIIKEDRILENLGERIRNIVKSPDDKIYFSTDSGNIYLLKN